MRNTDRRSTLTLNLLIDGERRKEHIRPRNSLYIVSDQPVRYWDGWKWIDIDAPGAGTLEFSVKVASGKAYWTAVFRAAKTGADDAYYYMHEHDLGISGGALSSSWHRHNRVILDPPGEAYSAARPFGHYGLSSLPYFALRVPPGREVTGRIYAQKSDYSGMETVPFRFKPDQMTGSPGNERGDRRDHFLWLRARYYESLAKENLPGTAWFRAQALESRRIVHPQLSVDELLALSEGAEQRTEDETFDFFSGGRAISENLQLERLLRPARGGEATAPVDSLSGISIAEMNWEPLVRDLKPPLDPLVLLLPADQHALLVPGVAALTTLMNEADIVGTPLLENLGARSENAGVRERYQRQLCLSGDALSRLARDNLISRIAITGSDPYLRTGTDVAVLFETKDPDALTAFLAKMHSEALSALPDTREIRGTIASTEYAGVTRGDRSVCSYRARIGDAIIVTNSLTQLERLVSVSQQKIPALAALPEYRFFRHRYPRDNPDETALLIITDATLRRWCGPKWRIASSRRARAAALLALAQATHLRELVKGVREPRPVTTLSTYGIGDLMLTPSGIASTTAGTLGFQTPISEVDVQLVTSEEAAAYTRWRDGYQTNWRGYFDPIAVSVSLKPERLTADVTVMPLIKSSRYRQYMNTGRRGKIELESHSLPWSVFQLAATNGSERPGFKGTYSLTAQSDPIWDEASKWGSWIFYLTNLSRLPVLLRADVIDRERAIASLTSELKAMSLKAETQIYRDTKYEVWTPGDESFWSAILKDATLYTAVLPRIALISFREDMFKQALDRELDGVARGGFPRDQESKVATKPWLGKGLVLQVDSVGLAVVSAYGALEYDYRAKNRAWDNLPILNEWRREFHTDPVAFHERWWHTSLTCPGGGRYIWNEDDQTMESTVYGHPARPKKGPAIPEALKTVRFANFGITFEHEGLRARMELDRSPPDRAQH